MNRTTLAWSFTRCASLCATKALFLFCGVSIRAGSCPFYIGIKSREDSSRIVLISVSAERHREATFLSCTVYIEELVGGVGGDGERGLFEWRPSFQCTMSLVLCIKFFARFNGFDEPDFISDDRAISRAKDLAGCGGRSPVFHLDWLMDASV